MDLSGEWAARLHEDWVHRQPGAELGDYTGMPLNDAGRLKARSWDPGILSLPQHQVMPHPATYSMRGPQPNFRMSKVVDEFTHQLVAYEIVGTYGRADRTIWLDGRPHPSPYAEHLFSGFSTGVMSGRNMLTVSTTHLKAGYINRNGVATSPNAKMLEHFIRHDGVMTLVTIITDPAYLEEPMIRTTSFVLTPNLGVDTRTNFEAIEEDTGASPDHVPSYPFGTLQDEYSQRHGIPYEATQGGAATLYPEYLEKLHGIMRGAAGK